MNTLLLRNMQMRKSESLQSFKEYRQSESQNPQQSSVHDDGTLLEYETLELRLHPPNVMVDNETYEDVTVVTIDSANRPGTLIEVVQTLTELNLSIRKARISSDGGWFVDEFFVSETPKGKVTDARKLNLIKQVLNVQQTDTPGAASQAKGATSPSSPSSASLSDDQSMCAVFEIAGRDQKGLLASVMELLTTNACEAQSAAVWTYHNQVALVISVIDSHEVHNQHLAKQQMLQQNGGGMRPGMQTPLSAQSPVRPGVSAMQQPTLNNHQPNSMKLQRLQGVLFSMLGGKEAHVTYEVVRCDTVHHERRLHHLLLLEELKSWQAQQLAQQLKARQLEAEAREKQQREQQEQEQLNSMANANRGDGETSAAGPGSQEAASSPSPATPSDNHHNSSPQQPSPSTPPATSPQGSTPGSSDLQHQPPSASSPQPLPQAPPPATPSMMQSCSSAGVGQINNALDGCAWMPFMTGGMTGSSGGVSGQYVRNTGASSITQGQNGSSEKNPNAVVGPSPGSPFVPAPTALLSHDLLNYSYLDPSHASLANLLRAEVTIQHSALLKYHLVTITCKDRNKLFFDTVCTLADMNYDVYHGTIDSKGDQASQLFYAKPRFGECMWDEKRARKLAYMLECAVQRRFPRGIRILMQAPARSAVPTIFSTLSATGFWVTRAEIRSLCGGVVFDFSLTDANGHIPSMAAVQKAFTEVGGLQAKELDSLMAVISMGGVGAAAAAAAAWPPTPAQAEAAAAAAAAAVAAGGGGSAAAGAAGHTTAHLLARPSLDLTRSMNINIPAGRFTFAFAGSVDKSRSSYMQTSASASHISS